ncbi:MAG: hypothetical protein ACYS1A_08440 [Planctomycetota bacterium]|jgi:hypothetical protein
MRKDISDIISSFREYLHAFTPDWLSSSRKMKIALIASASIAFILVVWALFPSSPTPLLKQSGLSPLSVTDENGDKWVLDLVRGQPLSRFKNSNIEPGPPLLIKTDTRIKGSNISIDLVVRGQAGELYVGCVKKNGQWTPQPKLKIVNVSGKLLAAGKFEYG